MFLTITSNAKTELIDVTAQVEKAVEASHIKDGCCILYIPHTTAAITINENADPTVKSDILKVLNDIIPWDADYRHSEGNSAAHIKSSLFGVSQMIPIENGKLMLGTWQGIFFCEFDGPRTRKLYLRMIAD